MHPNYLRVHHFSDYHFVLCTVIVDKLQQIHTQFSLAEQL